jgi:hypothetical protein
MATRPRPARQAAAGLKGKGETVWLKPGLIGRVRHLKGEQTLRHATLQEIKED